MRERGIHLNSEMVRAVLGGSKTQTRRPIKFPIRDKDFGCELSGNELAGEVSTGNYRNSLFGAVGDRLWVRESYRMPESLDRYSPQQVADLAIESGYRNPWAPIQLEADGVRTGKWNGFNTPPMITEPGKLRPSIHMPRWASRITLEITGVRVERLQDISRADAIAEGGPPSHPSIDAVSRDYGFPDFSRSWFGQTWWSIYGEESWQANPWVWVIEFKRLEGQ